MFFNKLGFLKLSVLYRTANDCFHNLYYSNEDIDYNRHLIATYAWLKTSQDRNGGICTGYSLIHGWSSPSASITSMCIPTFLEMAQLFDDNKTRERVQAMIDFLVINQQTDGSFCLSSLTSDAGIEGHIKETTTVLRELLLVHQQANLNEIPHICFQAARWVLSAQESLPDSLPLALYAHIACALARFGFISKENVYMDIAKKNIEKLLTSIEDNHYWIHNLEARRSQNVSVATIALTYRLIFETGCLLEQEYYKKIAYCASEHLLRRFEIKQDLPAKLYAYWSGKTNFSDIAGSVQLALLWLDIYEEEKDARFLNSTLKLLTLVGNAQCLTSFLKPVFHGIPETYPIWSGSDAFQLPTIAAKCFIEGLLRSERYIAEMDQKNQKASGYWDRASLPSVQAIITNEGHKIGVNQTKIVIMTGYQSQTFSLLVDKFIERGISIDACIIFCPNRSKLSKILRQGKLWRKFLVRKRRDVLDEAWYPGWANLTRDPRQRGSLPREIAIKRRIPYWEVRGVNSSEALRILNTLRPDLGILTGMGIIREPLLSVPRIGFLNAHNGLLPFYRGMDAVGWAFLNNDPIGCSVHFIDNGVDTGDLIATQVIEQPTDPLYLKQAIKETQINLLLWATEYIIEHGERPATYKQPDEGLQYYRMHPRLKAYLERKYQ